MTAGSDETTPGNALSPGPSAVPGVDVVKAALEHMFAGTVDGSTDAQADVASVDLLVADAIDARRHEQLDAVSSVIGTISDRYGREGVGRAISVLCGIIDNHMRREGQPDGKVEFKATIHSDLPGDQRAILVRSARLASDLVSATVAHDGAGLADALRSLASEMFDPILSILVTHAATTPHSSDAIRAQVTAAPDRRLCPTTRT